MAVRVISAQAPIKAPVVVSSECSNCRGPLNVGCGKSRSNCYCETEHDDPDGNCWQCGLPEQFTLQVASCFRLASTAATPYERPAVAQDDEESKEGAEFESIKPAGPRINVVAQKAGACEKYKQNRRGRPSNDVPCLACGKLVKEH